MRYSFVTAASIHMDYKGEGTSPTAKDCNFQLHLGDGTYMKLHPFVIEGDDIKKILLDSVRTNINLFAGAKSNEAEGDKIEALKANILEFAQFIKDNL